LTPSKGRVSDQKKPEDPDGESPKPASQDTGTLARKAFVMIIKL
jgi:hypothetical protein